MLTCQNVLRTLTRVILDATEIRIHKPTPLEFQQMTFSNYKNTNTYKAFLHQEQSPLYQRFIQALFQITIL